jgi:hypothetical protein
VIVVANYPDALVPRMDEIERRRIPPEQPGRNSGVTRADSSNQA